MLEIYYNKITGWRNYEKKKSFKKIYCYVINITLSGGEGADTYVFNVGDGKDKINNYDRGSWKSDKILFGEGVKPEDIKLTRKGYDMIITNRKSEGDEITLYNAFYSDYGYYYIGSIEFADKTVWNFDFINELVSQ